VQVITATKFLKDNMKEAIIEKWVEDKLVKLIFLHKINSIYQDSIKNIIIVETRDGRILDFTFENEQYALDGLKLLKEKLKIKNGL
jgi:hypothetical protein